MARTVIAIAAAVLVMILTSCAGPDATARIAEAERLRKEGLETSSRRAVSLFAAAIRTSDGNPAERLAASRGLGLAYQQLGATRHAWEAFEQGLPLLGNVERRARSEFRSEAGLALAAAAENPAELARAESLCLVAFEDARLSGSIRDEAKAMGCIGEAIYTRGDDLAPALEIQRSAARLWRQLDDSEGLAQALLAQGWLLSDLRRLPESRSVLTEASTLAGAARDARLEAIVLVAVARLSEREGDYQTALSLFDEAQEKLSVIGDAVWLGSALTGRATVFRYLGEFTRSRVSWQAALTAFEKTGLTLPTIDALMSLGATLSAAGDDEGALESLRRAQQLAVNLGNRRMSAWALREIAALELLRDSPEGAERVLQDALQIIRGYGDARLEASILADLGRSAERRDAFELALDFYRRAREISSAAGDRAGVADHSHSLGTLKARLGRHEEARQDLESGLRERIRLFGPHSTAVAQTKVALASATLVAGDVVTASRTAVEAEALALEHLRVTIQTLAEHQALTFAARQPRGIDVAVSSALAAQAQPLTRAALELIVSGRASVLDELAARRAMRDARPAVVEARAAGRARQLYANLLVGSLNGASSQGLETARRTMQLAEQAEAEALALSRNGAARPLADLRRILDALPPGSALVSFVQFVRHRPHGGAEEPALAAFVVRASPERVAIVDLGAVAAVDSAVRAWRRELSASLSPPGLIGPDSGALLEAGSRVRRAVWDPVSRHVDKASLVFIVPDGSVGLVSFDALPSSAQHFLAEGPTIFHYLSTERDVSDLQAKPLSENNGLLVVGGPAYGASVSPEPASKNRSSDAAPPCAPPQLRFSALPGAVREAQELWSMWPASRGRRQMLSGPQATESKLKELAGGFSVVHLATHGFFVDGPCESPLADRIAQVRGVGGVTRSSVPDKGNPLRLAGLALAGANLPTLAGADDGVLTAEEVSTLALEGVDWAVLSACDTGVGEVRASEGVFGLRRAFRLAGVRTVIMSLWPVDDEATRAWMQWLYRGRFAVGLTTPQAMREARLKVLLQRRAEGQNTHPLYWAGFVAAGDWR